MSKYQFVNGAWVKNSSQSAPAKTPASKPPLPSSVAKPRAVLSPGRTIHAKGSKAGTVVPPNDGECEQAVLGCMIIESQAIVTARRILKPYSFYYLQHGLIFQACLNLIDRKVVPDIVLLAAELRDKGHMDEIGGGEYLAECINRVTYAGHVGHYATKVQALHLERQIIQSCAELSINQGRESLDKLHDLHMQKQQLESPMLFDYSVNIPQALEDITNPKIKKRLPIGYPTIDAAWKGQKPGEVNVWAAATNEGKSVLALNISSRALKLGRRVLYIGTEMEATETLERHLSIESGVEAWKLRKPELNERDTKRLVDAARNMSELNMFILDDPEPSLHDVEAAIHNCKPDDVIWDYLERFEMPKGDQLRLQIKEFMRRLKSMTRRTGIVSHLIAQLNRDTYGSEQRAPTLADLSESSAIEKEADRVMLLYTPSSGPSGKGPNAKPAPAPVPGLPDHCKILHAINAKNRHGMKGLVFEFVFDQLTLKIQELKEFKDPFNHKTGGPGK